MTTVKIRAGGLTPEHIARAKRVILTNTRLGKSIADCLAITKIKISMFHKWRKEDPDFARDFENALDSISIQNQREINHILERHRVAA